MIRKYKIPFVLLLMMTMVIAVATLIENREGTAFAHSYIYGAWWFRILWMAIVGAGVWYCYQCRLWHRTSVALLHASFVVILLGALVTSLTGFGGILHLRQGIPTMQFIGSDAKLKDLPSLVRLDTFYIDYYPETDVPMDYHSLLTIGGDSYHISMNHIAKFNGYRLYQTSFDADEKGTILTVSHDPWGTGITYCGYALLLLGVLGVNLRGVKIVSPSLWLNGSRFVRLLPAVCFAVLLWLRWALLGYVPLSNDHETLLFLVLCLLVLTALLRRSWVAWGLALLFFVIAQLTKRDGTPPLMPILRSPWLFIHVSVVMISYALLVISLFERRLLRLGVCLLAVGIFLGATWANVSWGTYWSWDPKEAWALVTLLVYSLPLHTESLPWLRSNRNYRIYSLVALATLMMTYFGVNYLLGGLHSYA